MLSNLDDFWARDANIEVIQIFSFITKSSI